MVHVYVDGAPVAVPANIGISAAARLESPLHTHDATGLVHIEADQPHDFRLADFFAVWGVAFSGNQIGGFRNAGDRVLQAFANGQRIADPAMYVIRAGDNIAVGFGTQGSFPSSPASDASGQP